MVIDSNCGVHSVRVSGDRDMGRIRARAHGAVSRLHALCRHDQRAARDTRSDPGDFAAAAVCGNGESIWLAGGRGIFTIWIGHVMLCISYVAIIVESRVRELNPSLEEAALDLGATPLRVFFAITLPLISQALVAGWMLSFTLSIDDLVLSAFLSGPGSTTLPLVVFSRVRLGLNPEMNALATLFIAFVTVGVIAANYVMQRSERKRLTNVL